MGIKIELTDDKIIEPSGGIAMFDLPGREFPGNEDVLFDLRWSVTVSYTHLTLPTN